jgi:hypothetical protein
MLDIYNIDYNANQVMIHKEERLRVYDLGTCEEVLNVPVSYWGLDRLNLFAIATILFMIQDRGVRLKINQ